ncbi:MAG: efflux RND transporter periplasmic adaptor subunit [Xanthomonadales bacterium]|nr:efflux RND transporter periplasmic adaptor subunit [Xanthomonadales bacterium]
MTLTLRRSRWLVGLCSALLVVTASGQGGPPPQPVSVRPVVNAQLAPVTWVPGTVVARADSRLGAEVSGRLVSLAEVGTSVAKGEVIARSDTGALRLELQRQQAAVDRLQAQLHYRQQQVGRFQALAERNAAAGDQLDSAQAEQAMTAADLAQAKAQLAEVRYRIERSELRAPFAGLVVEQLAQPGEFLAPGTPVLRLVDVHQREISARAPLAAFRHLSEGQTLPVRQGDRTIELKVSRRIEVGDPISRSAELRLSLADEDWVVGSAVEVSVPESAGSEGLAVHRDALLLRAGQRYVYRIGDDGKAERVDVEVGLAVGDQVQISGPLQAGDLVVVRGGERLANGMTVQVLAPTSMAASARVEG